MRLLIIFLSIFKFLEMPIYPGRFFNPYYPNPRYFTGYYPPYSPYYPYPYPYPYPDGCCYDSDGDCDDECDSLATQVKPMVKTQTQTQAIGNGIEPVTVPPSSKKRSIVLKPVATNSSPILTQDQINEITAYINNYRQIHQAPALIWDVTIAQFSQTWANYLLNNNLFQHSGSSLYGENLAYFKGYGTDLMSLLKLAVDMWYNEITLYDFNKPGFSEATGHFTALIWKSSTTFGMGFAINPTTTAVDITMNLSPPGNVEGEYITNVLPAISPVVVPPATPVPTVITPNTIVPVPVPIPAPPPPSMPMPPIATNTTVKIPPMPPHPQNIYHQRDIHHHMQMEKASVVDINTKAAIVSLLYNVINELNKNKSKDIITNEINNTILELVNS